MLSTIVFGVIFTVLYVVEAFFLFAGSIHGSVWLAPVAFVFALASSTHIWRSLLTRPPTKPLGSVIAIGFLIGLVPPIIFIVAVAVAT